MLFSPHMNRRGSALDRTSPVKNHFFIGGPIPLYVGWTGAGGLLGMGIISVVVLPRTRVSLQQLPSWVQV